MTNKHVVADEDAEYTVITNEGKSVSVLNISRDPLNDLALLKVNSKDLVPIKLGDSSKIKLGQIVIAIGTPLGEFPNTVTSGIISGLGRGITAVSYTHLFVYPYGRYGDTVISTLKKYHYKAAFSTDKGTRHCLTTVYALPRLLSLIHI